MKRFYFISIQKKKKKDGDFSMLLTFSIKSNQNESKKHKLLGYRFPFTKTHFQDFLFRINRPKAFFRENDRTTFDFIENDIFQTHVLKIRKNK